MNRGIQATATGMVAAERWMDVTANNLANVSTAGFKRDGLSFTDTYVRTIAADGGMGRTLGTLGSGAGKATEFTNHQVGAISNTGNPLDVAIQTEAGLFKVQQNGETAYTRSGEFGLNSERQLVTTNGALVMDTNNREITLPQGKLEIGSDGSVSVDGKSVATIGLWDGSFQKTGGNLFSATGTPSLLDSERVQLKQGAVEGSNVNAIDAMITMITIGRSYDLSQKAITSEDDLTQKLMQTLQ